MGNPFLLPILVLLSVSSSPTATFASSVSSFLQCLPKYSNPSTAISNAIYTPDNSSFSEIFLSRTTNLRLVPSGTTKPLAIITALHESHVQATVLCAKTHGLQVRIRSGGHDYEGLSYRSQVPFIILDMFRLNSIVINEESKTAVVQAGATLGQLYHAISQKSQTLAFPAGVCPTIGAGGHILGGGYGNLVRMYGLAADNVMDAQIVNVKGEILDKKSMGKDVFWAIRGSGGTSYGVIISWTVKLVPVPPKVTVFKVNKTMEAGATQVVYKWQHIAPKLPQTLFIRVMPMVTNGKQEGTKTVSTFFIGQFLGLTSELVPLLNRRFPELGLKESDCHEVSWAESALFWANYPLGTSTEVLLEKPKPPKAFMKFRSDYVNNPIPKPAIDSIWEFMIRSKSGWMQWNPFGGRMSEISESETPYPQRRVSYLIQYAQIWMEEGDNFLNQYLNVSRSLFQFMEPYVTKSPREAYINYRALEIGAVPSNQTIPISAKVYGRKYFKGNFERLVEAKRRFDPDNFFKNEQSVPLLAV